MAYRGYPVTKKPRYLVEHVPAVPRAAVEAAKVRTRLLAQVDERRNTRDSDPYRAGRPLSCGNTEISRLARPQRAGCTARQVTAAGQVRHGLAHRTRAGDPGHARFFLPPDHALVLAAVRVVSPRGLRSAGLQATNEDPSD